VLLAAIALGATAGGDAGVAAATVAQGAMLQQQINFTRSNEQEADRIGIDILVAAGHEPRAMPAFFSRMGKVRHIYADELPEFLLTHPISTSRISDSLGRAAKYPYVQSRDDLRYQLLKVLLREKTLPEQRPSVAEFDRVLAEGRYRNRSAAEFGRALALARSGERKQAISALRGLLQRHPEQVEFLVTLAQLKTQTGEPDRALQRLERALLQRPTSYALNISLAELALAHRQAGKALTQLEKYLAHRDQDPYLYRLLARAATQLRKQQLAHEYQALAHYAEGHLKKAILQLEIALRAANNSFFERARLESRLQRWRKELAELVAAG